MTEDEVSRIVLAGMPEGVRVQTAERHEPDEHSEAAYWKVRLTYEAPDNSGTKGFLIASVNDATGEITASAWYIG